MRRISLLLTLCFPMLLPAQPAPSKTPWEPLSLLVGNWEGTSQGEPGHGEGRREYQFILRGQFLQVKNKTVYPPQEKNQKGETHEDMGLFSYDTRRGQMIWLEIPRGTTIAVLAAQLPRNNRFHTLETGPDNLR